MGNVDPIVMTVLGLISVNLIIPFTDVAKKYWIPDKLAFLTWGVQAVLSFLFSWFGAILFMPTMTGVQVLTLGLAIMGGAGASHANNKMRGKMKNGNS